MAETNTFHKAEDFRKVDYQALLAQRLTQWADMLEELKASGWKIIPVNTHDGFTARLFIHPMHPGSPRGMVIVCAGGGFMFKSRNEAQPVAEFFYQAGFNTALLDYYVDSVTPMGTDMDIRRKGALDGIAAVRYLRAHADELGILPDQICIGGFSAGGYVSAYTATHYDEGDPQAPEPELRVSSRPDAVLVLYGAKSLSIIQNSGRGVFDYEQQARLASYDTRRSIHPGCPPMFVFQTHKDDPRFALKFCMELAGCGVPYELHTFEEGGHGGGLYDGQDPDSPHYPHTAGWAELAAEWLKINRGFICQ